jgi:hypothetical protein
VPYRKRSGENAGEGLPQEERRAGDLGSSMRPWQSDCPRSYLGEALTVGERAAPPSRRSHHANVHDSSRSSLRRADRRHQGVARTSRPDPAPARRSPEGLPDRARLLLGERAASGLTVAVAPDSLCSSPSSRGRVARVPSGVKPRASRARIPRSARQRGRAVSRYRAGPVRNRCASASSAEADHDAWLGAVVRLLQLLTAGGPIARRASR